MNERTIAVTGANRGIGLEIVRIFLDRGDRVFALCRKAGDALPATGADVIEGVDVASSDALRRAVDGIDAGRIDILVANAGILSSEQFDDLGSPDAQERIKRQFEVDALGPLFTVHALAGKLGDGSKVALITSRMGSIADNDSGGQYGYRMAKAALNAGGRSLAIDLGQRGVSVGLLHPGYVRTEMTDRKGNVEAAEAAAMLVARIDDLGPDLAGSFRHANGDTLPW